MICAWKVIWSMWPMCYYCGVPSHPRSECRLRLRELEGGIKRPFHPSRGNLPSGNQLRKEAANQLSNAADQYGNPWLGIPANQAPGAQWANNNTQPNTITITITDPELAAWASHFWSSGSVIVMVMVFGCVLLFAHCAPGAWLAGIPNQGFPYWSAALDS